MIEIRLIYELYKISQYIPNQLVNPIISIIKLLVQKAFVCHFDTTHFVIVPNVSKMKIIIAILIIYFCVFY